MSANLNVRSLCEGVHDLTEPLILSGEAPALIGESRASVVVRRGRKPDGALYEGPLILLENARNATLSDLTIQGSRFRRQGGGFIDERHPLTPDRTSPKFLCGTGLPEPACFDHQSYRPFCDPDIVIRNATDVALSRLDCLDAIGLAIAIGQGSSRVRLSECRIDRAGDYGVWIGAGPSPPDARLPLPAPFIAILPKIITLDDTLVERCGAAGIYVEGCDVRLVGTRLLGNCCDAPYDDEGGQLTVDYKTDGLVLDKCEIVGGPAFVRMRSDGSRVLLGAMGVEACGNNMQFRDTLIEGNGREGIQFMGARAVRVAGRTRIFNNNLAQFRHSGFSGNPQRQNVSITTPALFASLNAVANDFAFEDTYCENGIVVWSDGSVPDLTLDALQVARCDLTGPDGSGVSIGVNSSGRSLRGANWKIESPR